MSRKRKAQKVNLKQLLAHFSTEEHCIAWLEQARTAHRFVRIAKGVRCPVLNAHHRSR